MPIAYNLYKPFVPIRKKGKLPGETIEMEYALEYGTASIEIHKDSIHSGQKVVIINSYGALKQFPAKEKKKIVVLREIIKRFKTDTIEKYSGLSGTGNYFS